ncbi:MAG: hypothetical protein GXP22_00340 [Gammaproteobacteria bacterium]|nr:hypothetical protein [Gammaproteobacteria bacterium]
MNYTSLTETRREYISRQLLLHCSTYLHPCRRVGSMPTSLRATVSVREVQSLSLELTGQQ